MQNRIKQIILKIKFTDKLGHTIHECSDFDNPPQQFPVRTLSSQEIPRQYSSDSIIRRQTKIMFVLQKGGRLQRELRKDGAK